MQIYLLITATCQAVAGLIDELFLAFPLDSSFDYYKLTCNYTKIGAQIGQIYSRQPGIGLV